MALYDVTQHGCFFLVCSLTQKKRKLALNRDDPRGTDVAHTDRQCGLRDTVVMSSALGSQSETTERKKEVEAVAG